MPNGLLFDSLVVQHTTQLSSSPTSIKGEISMVWSMAMTFVMVFTVLLVGRTAFAADAKFFGKFSFREEISAKQNMAVSIRFVGMLAGLMVAVFGAYRPTGNVVSDISDAVYVLVFALVAMMISQRVNDFCILAAVDNGFEVVSGQNKAVATVEAATYVATAFIFAGSMSSPENGLWYNIGSFVVGQIALIALAFIFRVAASVACAWKVFHEIEEEGNVASGLSLAGFLLSGGITMGAALHGTSMGFGSDIGIVGAALLVWLCIMVAGKAAMYWIVLPGKKMIHEMSANRNWGYGLADAVLSVGLASVFVAIHAS